MSISPYFLDNKVITVPVPASTAIAVGSLAYANGTTDVRPASSQADAGSLVLNQAVFAKNFAGVFLDQRLSTQTTAGTAQLATDITLEMPCDSASFDVGDLVGAVETSGGDALENAKVVEVSDPILAIGMVVEAVTSSTKVKVRLIAKKFASHNALQSDVNGRTRVNTETLAGTKTLVVSDAFNQVLDPGGAGRNVVLPNEAASAGKEFRIHNSAGAAEILTIKDSGGSTTVCTPTQNETAIVWCDGTTWRGVVGANN